MRFWDLENCTNFQFYSVYQLSQFVMIFVTVPVGILGALLRVITSMVLGMSFVLGILYGRCTVGLWLIPRLDISTVSRPFEGFDAGYWSYICMLHTELYHTHPVRLSRTCR